MAEKNSIPQFVNSESIMANSNYVKWLSDLKEQSAKNSTSNNND